MSEFQLKEGHNFKTTVSVELFIWKQADIHFVYSPALDLVGYGYTAKEAKDSFETVLADFIEYTNDNNTLFDDLEELGWKVDRKRQKIKTPSRKEILEKAEEDESTFKEVLNSENYRIEERNVQLACR